MSKEFVPYEMALAMKELGFDNVNCLAIYYGDYTKEERDWEFGGADGFVLNSFRTQYYTQKAFQNGILAPLYQQVFRWFREKGYHYGIIPRSSICSGVVIKQHNDEFHYFIKDFVNNKEYDDVYNISSYEEAELACLRKLIEIVKEN